MNVLPNMTMRALMSQIVEATHSLTDESGARLHIGTMEEKALRMAAKHAIETAIGMSVWMGDEKIVIADQPRSVGIFEFRK